VSASAVARAHKLARLLAGPALYRRALLRGVAAAVEHHEALRITGAASVYDVGANKGQFYLAVRRTLPEARIVCFEPLADPRRRLEQVVAGDAGVEVHPYALSDRPGPAKMTVTARADSSSLLEPTERQLAVFPGTHAVGSEDVACRTLDGVESARDLSPPSLLKIDVQGGELAVLEGGRRTVPSFDWVYVECSYVELYAGQPLFGDVAAHLRGQGFTLHGRTNVVRDARGSEIQADCLFRRGRS
jgi:FkbM family methyltransferase